jgi:CTP:molybdopterin cytidylyltransferase MocA
LTSSRAILILAAGQGRRFGGDQQKYLVPLIGGEGSLQRLLRQLLLLAPDTKIGVVVGHRARAVEAAVGALSSTISCFGDASLANGSPLATIVAGLKSLASDRHLKGAWVLFADTLYHPQALERFLASDADRLLLASQPASPGAAGDLVGLRLEPGSSQLIALGPEEPLSQGVMAPAVYWPRPFWSSLAEAADRGHALQWQLLRDHLPETPVTVLALPPDHAYDIDTPDDLQQAQRILVAPQAVASFRRSVSKEERNLEEPDRLVDCGFQKHCPSAGHAAIEASALNWLSAHPGLRVPAVLKVEGPTLLLEPLRGIRLYDLLRLLRTIEAQRPERAAQASQASLVLLRRGLEQLVQLQRALLAWPAAAQRPAYPLASHVAGLLAAMVRLLGLPPLLASECRELHKLRCRWEATDALVPFRDATAKNILVGIGELAPAPGLSPTDRLARLLSWLDRQEVDTVPLIDFDFTSVVHRTAPEDDLFSLLGHAGSLPVSQKLLAELVPDGSAWPHAVAQLVGRIHPEIKPNPERAARALLVRYLRFGGRKLLYRLVNPAAYAVRFRYDNPAFYFAQLPIVLPQLDPGFGASFPLLMARLLQLGKATALLPAWSAREASHDLYETNLGLSIPYWQESPLEIAPLIEATPPGR